MFRDGLTETVICKKSGAHRRFKNSDEESTGFLCRVPIDFARTEIRIRQPYRLGANMGGILGVSIGV